MRNNKLIKNLSHISMYSNNLRLVEKFYCKILKFKIIHKFINKKKKIYGLFLLVGKNSMIEFFLSKNKFLKIQKFRHICFEVKNINKVKKIFKKKCANLEVKRGKTDHTLNFCVKDFEGNEIEFHQYDKKSKLTKYLK